VLEVELDRGLHVRDVLHDEHLFLHERSATHSLKAGMWMIADICRYDRHWEIDGALQVLPPRARIRVVQALLVDPPDAIGVIDTFHRSFRPPRFVNTDGHLVVPTELVLDLRWPALLEAAATWRDAVVEEDQVVIHGAESSALGGPAIRASFTEEDGSVLLSVNSRERADQMLARLPGVEVVDRNEHELAPSDPDGEPMIVDMSTVMATSTEEAESRFQTDRVARWPDEPIPALDGLTPRQALEAGRLAEVRALAPEDAGQAFFDDLGIHRRWASQTR
jgi:hypothetical protein